MIINVFLSLTFSTGVSFLLEFSLCTIPPNFYFETTVKLEVLHVLRCSCSNFCIVTIVMSWQGSHCDGRGGGTIGK